MNSGLPGGIAESSDCFICVKSRQNAAYLFFLLLTQIHFGISFLAVSEGIQPTHYHMSCSSQTQQMQQTRMTYFITAGTFPKRTQYCTLWSWNLPFYHSTPIKLICHVRPRLKFPYSSETLAKLKLNCFNVY